MMNNLEQNIIGTGYWDYSRENLDILGITNKWYISTVPKIMDKLFKEKEIIWMTAVVYSMLTIYYSQKE